ncbi:Asp-tRNA(Asn)/Glu-tRNA(Gln) amidotransferase subunit GatB, partial [Patescibacteria group bacterium]|nr:Asp-tRNA(Asn)/Glu-tRNA(Gln) amidotransferase subunit GatB [Patescibacteria group bacterium]
AEFITMLFTNKVSTKNANLLLERMLETGGDPSNILEDEDLSSGDLDLEKLVQEIINKNPEQVSQFKAGKTNLLKFFLGQAMKESQGKANPQEAENLLLQKLA